MVVDQENGPPLGFQKLDHAPRGQQPVQIMDGGGRRFVDDDARPGGRAGPRRVGLGPDPFVLGVQARLAAGFEDGPDLEVEEVGRHRDHGLGDGGILLELAPDGHLPAVDFGFGQIRQPPDDAGGDGLGREHLAQYLPVVAVAHDALDGTDGFARPGTRKAPGLVTDDEVVPAGIGRRIGVGPGHDQHARDKRRGPAHGVRHLDGPRPGGTALIEGDDGSGGAEIDADVFRVGFPARRHHPGPHRYVQAQAFPIGAHRQHGFPPARRKSGGAQENVETDLGRRTGKRLLAGDLRAQGENPFAQQDVDPGFGTRHIHDVDVLGTGVAKDNPDRMPVQGQTGIDHHRRRPGLQAHPPDMGLDQHHFLGQLPDQHPHRRGRGVLAGGPGGVESEGRGQALARSQEGRQGQGEIDGQAVLLLGAHPDNRQGQLPHIGQGDGLLRPLPFQHIEKPHPSRLDPQLRPGHDLHDQGQAHAGIVRQHEIIPGQGLPESLGQAVGQQFQTDFPLPAAGHPHRLVRDDPHQSATGRPRRHRDRQRVGRGIAERDLLRVDQAAGQPDVAGREGQGQIERTAIAAIVVVFPQLPLAAALAGLSSRLAHAAPCFRKRGTVPPGPGRRDVSGPPASARQEFRPVPTTRARRPPLVKSPPGRP